MDVAPAELRAAAADGTLRFPVAEEDAGAIERAVAFRASTGRTGEIPVGGQTAHPAEQVSAVYPTRQDESQRTWEYLVVWRDASGDEHEFFLRNSPMPGSTTRVWVIDPDVDGDYGESIKYAMYRAWEELGRHQYTYGVTTIPSTWLFVYPASGSNDLLDAYGVFLGPQHSARLNDVRAALEVQSGAVYTGAALENNLMRASEAAWGESY